MFIKKWVRLLAGVTLSIGAVYLCASCTDFFSHSLAPWAARDPSSLIPSVTVSNVDELIRKAENNPDLSLAVLKKIQSAADSASDGERSVLQAAALQAAVNAASLGPQLMKNAGNISELTNDSAKAQGAAIELLTKSLGAMGNLSEAGALLEAILPDPNDTTAFDAFVAAASADDLAMGAAVLLGAAAKKQGDPGAYLAAFDSSGGSPSPSETLAVKLAAAAKDKNDAEGGGGLLADILKGLKLVP
ncbi:hypothetical protein ACYULU_13075 [Breznakiellaceae bacterium SP9]